MVTFHLNIYSLGADLEIRDDQGFTPIFTAVEHGFVSMLKVLVQHGCNLNDNLNWNQRSLLMCAAKRGRCACLRILLQAGASLRLRDSNGINALTKAVLQYPFNTECINLLYAAGDDDSLVMKEYSSHHIPYLTMILQDHKELPSLKETTRKAIRKYLMGLFKHRHGNLFVTISQLPLPWILRNFLLFKMDSKNEKLQ